VTKLPQANGDRLLRALQKDGWEIERTRGSHFVLVNRRDRSKTVVVPAHNRPIKVGTLAAILKGAEMSPERLRELL
jgi:predicted RNA binding protein YcfA (HicA-like mRNA interferase family)